MIKFHILNASAKLDNYAAHLLALGERAVAAINQQMAVDRVDVTFQYNPGFTIPEVGVCGYAPTAHLVQISLDPENSNFDANLDEELPATLAHELHHCMRWRGPGYGRQLQEALVTEGLARDFEIGFRHHKKLPIYHRIFTAAQLEDLLVVAEKEFGNPKYNHEEWFFTGSDSKGIPPFAGYTLGYEIVRKFNEANGYHSGELWNEPAATFFKG